MRDKRRIFGDNRPEKLEYLKSLEYDVLLKQRKDKFYLYIMELSLVVVDQDLNQAYKDLNTKKHDFFDKILDCDSEDEVILPNKQYRSNQLAHQLRIFILKLLIVCVLGCATFIFGAKVINDKITEISGGDIFKQVTRGVTMEAMKFVNTPDDTKQVRIKKLRQFLETLRPWIDEFKDVFLSPSIGQMKNNNSNS